MSESDEEIIERAEKGGVGWLREADVARLALLARRGLTARDEALEEAAKVADTCFGPPDEALTVGEASGYDLAMDRIATAIRALKRT